MQMVKCVGLMSCIAKSSHGVPWQDRHLSWEEKLHKDFLRDPATERGLVYPAANPIINSQAGELHINCSHVEAAACCCLAMPASPYTGIVRLLKRDHCWKPCPMVSLNTSALHWFCPGWDREVQGATLYSNFSHGKCKIA